MTVVPNLSFTNRKWTVKDTCELDRKYTVKSQLTFDSGSGSVISTFEMTVHFRPFGWIVCNKLNLDKKREK